MQIRPNPNLTRRAALWFGFASLGLIPGVYPAVESTSEPLAVVAPERMVVAETQAARLRTQSLGLIDASRHRAAGDFAPLVRKLDESVAFSLAKPLQPIDFSTPQGRSTEAWKLWGHVVNLHSWALAFSLPESAYSDSPEMAKRLREGMAFMLSAFAADGSIHSTDPNLDRFVFTQFFDAALLAWPALTPEQQADFIRLTEQVWRYQQKTYAATPVAGHLAGYPNMDAAYLQILRQAAELFDDDVLRTESAERVRLLGECLTGNTYDYIEGWPSDPGYTMIALTHLGRYWQMSNDPEALRQIQLHPDYYKWFLEPGGQMDYGISPYIKHRWNLAPFGAANLSLELVQTAAPTSVGLGQAAKLRAFLLESNHRVIHPLNFYWMADVTGKAELAPENFLRPSAELAGWQMRQTTPLGTWTANLFGRKVALDTRVSALATPAQRPPNSDANTITATALAGVFLEIFQDGVSYFLGEMEPRIETQVDEAAGTVTLTTTQTRRSTGPTGRPMRFGERVGQATGVWTDGGLPKSLPIETVERWTLGSGRLDGELSVRTEAPCRLDEVRLSAVPALPRIAEKRVDGRTVLARYGTLCVQVTATEGDWHPDTANLTKEEPFHFRVDLPDGIYDVTLTSGDFDHRTAPFSVDANGRDTGVVLGSNAGEFAVKTFREKVSGGSLRLRFRTSPLEHWKINAIKITRATDGAPIRAFDVGPTAVPPASGYERLDGVIYDFTRGFGWAENYSGQERSRSSVGTDLRATLITSDSPGQSASPVLVLTDGSPQAKEIPAGKSWRAQVRVRQAASLEQFLKLP